LATDTTLVNPPAKSEAQYIVYARVSSADQENDLDQQIARVMAFAGKQKLPVVDTVTEVGNGLDGQRKRLQRILGATPHHIIVELGGSAGPLSAMFSYRLTSVIGL
jgi:putative resolvase